MRAPFEPEAGAYAGGAAHARGPTAQPRARSSTTITGARDERIATEHRIRRCADGVLPLVRLLQLA